MKRSVIKLIIMISMCGFAGYSYAVEIAGIAVHGLLSQGYVKTTENNYFADTEAGSYQFNEFALNFNKDLYDRLHIGAQLFARDLGDTGDDRLEIDWAYMDYHFQDWLGIMAGKIKVPHGLYNQTRDVDMLRNSILLPQSVYPEILRDTTLSMIGAGIDGNFGIWKLGGLSYQAAIGLHNQDIAQGERTMQSLMDTTSDNTGIRNDSININSKYAASLVWDTPLEGLRFSETIGNTKMSALSHAIIDDPPMMTKGDKIYQNFNKFQYIVYSTEYTWNELIITGEHMTTKREITRSFRSNLNHAGEKLRSDGWYANISYRFNSWFSSGAYYSKTRSKVVGGEGDHREDRISPPPGGAGSSPPPEAGGDTPEPAALNRAYQKDLCLTARFDMNDYIVFKLEGHDIRGTNGLSPFDNPEDANGNRWTDDWKMFAAKITFSF